MKTVLLTGATGFIGRHVIGSLVDRGFNVHAVGRNQPDHPDVQWHPLDILDEDQIRRTTTSIAATHLLHFAWYVEHGSFWTSSENLRWVAATLDLVRAFVEAGGRRMTFAGTCAEYDWTGGECREYETPTRPATLYGMCKHATHITVAEYARQAGLSMAWGRIFFLYGPGEARGRLVPSVTLPLLRGEPALCTHGEQVRDFLHVADAADAFAAILDSSVEGPVNVASGRPVALKDVIAGIASRLDAADRIRLGALPAMPADPAALTASVSRLQNEVGWRPSRDLDRGLDEVIAWWRAIEGDLPESLHAG